MYFENLDAEVPHLDFNMLDIDMAFHEAITICEDITYMLDISKHHLDDELVLNKEYIEKMNEVPILLFKQIRNQIPSIPPQDISLNQQRMFSINEVLNLAQKLISDYRRLQKPVTVNQRNQIIEELEILQQRYINARNKDQEYNQAIDIRMNTMQTTIAFINEVLSVNS